MKNINVGMIIKNEESGIHYRLIAVIGSECVLCNMDTTKFELYLYKLSDLYDLMMSGILKNRSEEQIVFDYNNLSEKMKSVYNKRKSMMLDVIDIYEPSFMGLMGKKSKPELEKIYEKYQISRPVFWKFCTRYFQSGMKDYALIDKRYWGNNTGKNYNFISKPGAKPKYFEQTGVVINEEIKKYYEEALRDFKSGRQKTIKSAYDKMNLMHFSRVEMINGIQNLTLLSESERPTIRQFRYYVNTHMTKQERDEIKTSAREQRNNKRLLTSDVMKNVLGPGDMVEIDAVEADVSLVSELDNAQSIGRPINYFMVDVYTRTIVAISVAFDNNSVLGLTNLFLNLADNKKDFCMKYGVEFDTSKVWPSNFIPRRIRVDRGADFKSKDFDRICNALGIEKQIVSGGTGSLKGVVEQSFHQMHSQQNVHLENYGLIEKRYDSKHHKEAVLTIHEYTKMIINFVLFHNQQYNKNYPLTKAMLEENIQPVPAILWDYGVAKYGRPRPIPQMEQYLFDLMTPVKASLSKRGICYKNLWYLPKNDSELTKEMFNAGTKKIPFDIRIDKRDVGTVYYLRDNKLIHASLNSYLTGNADYAGMTLKEYEDFMTKKKQMDAKGRVYNEKLSSYLYGVDESIVDEAKKDTYANEKELSKHRELDKQNVSRENNIRQRLKEDKTIEEKKPKDTREDNDIQGFTSFEEALSIFDDDF